MTGGPYILEPAYTDEDLEILITVESGESVEDWALAFRLWRPDGTEVVSGVAVSVTDVDARELTATITGLTLSPGLYSWEVRRTDVGARTVVSLGTIRITDERP